VINGVRLPWLKIFRIALLTKTSSCPVERISKDTRLEFRSSIKVALFSDGALTIIRVVKLN
jgi:hypothetical protein